MKFKNLEKYKEVLDLFLVEEVPTEMVKEYYFGEDEDSILQEYVLNHLKHEVEWSTGIGILDAVKTIVYEAEVNCNI